MLLINSTSLVVNCQLSLILRIYISNFLLIPGSVELIKAEASTGGILKAAIEEACLPCPAACLQLRSCAAANQIQSSYVAQGGAECRVSRIASEYNTTIFLI